MRPALQAKYPAGLEFEESSICKVCDEPTQTAASLMQGVPDLDLPGGRSFSIERCLACETAFTRPVPTPETISLLYSDGISSDIELPEPGPIGALKDAFARSRMRAIVRGLHGRPRSILDYATGGGRFAAAATRVVPEAIVTGVDFAEEPPKNSYYTSCGGLRYVSFSKFTPSQRYDLIVARHVLEHVHRPVEMVARLVELLNTNGTLYLETPNLASVTARILGPRWPLLYVPRHLTHFTRATLGETVRRAGASARMASCEIPMMGNVVALALGKPRYDPLFRPLGLLLHPAQIILERIGRQGTCLVAFVGRNDELRVSSEANA